MESSENPAWLVRHLETNVFLMQVHLTKSPQMWRVRSKYANEFIITMNNEGPRKINLSSLDSQAADGMAVKSASAKRTR